MRFCRVLFFVLAVSGAVASPTKSTEPLEQTINYLINCIANSGATFIRNGAHHTAAEAAQHVRMKYEHFKKEIVTPEDFIRLSASKSLVTGQFYLVRLPNGREMRLDVWLMEALEQHRSERHL
jgi:hypothetical protein